MLVTGGVGLDRGGPRQVPVCLVRWACGGICHVIRPAALQDLL